MGNPELFMEVSTGKTERKIKERFFFLKRNSFFYQVIIRQQIPLSPAVRETYEPVFKYDNRR